MSWHMSQHMMACTQVILRCWSEHGMMKCDATRRWSDNLPIECTLRWLDYFTAMKFADCSPCNALISFMTHCPLITLIFGIAIPLYIGYLGAVSSNYNIVVNVEFENYLQAESKLQSMDNAYVRLVEEQATIVEESRKRRFFHQVSFLHVNMINKTRAQILHKKLHCN